HYLRELGVRPNKRVGICVERNLEMVVGLLAILKAGGAYVPLDPADPAGRLKDMLEDSEAADLLTQGHLRSQLGEISVSLPVIEMAETDLWEEQPESDPERGSIGLTPEHLAYVIYTSGTSGKPKGVMVWHPGIVRL